MRPDAVNAPRAYYDLVTMTGATTGSRRKGCRRFGRSATVELGRAYGEQEADSIVDCSRPDLRTHRQDCARPIKGAAHDRSLSAFVADYRRECHPRLEAQLRSFAAEPDIQSAVSRASMAQTSDGKRFSHQRRIRTGVVQEVHRRLLDLDLGRHRHFDDLYAAVDRAIGSIPGSGELLIYDTSLRIGAWLGIMPDRVCLHRGTRKGARALGLAWKQTRLAMDDLPEPLRGLKPHEVEDFLCIFKEQFGPAGTQGS